MKKNIPFIKMVASGNDFIVIDNRRKIVTDIRLFARQVCRQHFGIGADGVLLFESSKKADFRMRIINSDGSEAEACGNGFRCIARFAKERLGFPNRFCFESLSGLNRAEISGKRIKISLPEPSAYRAGKDVKVGGHVWPYAFINTGVPHAVLWMDSLDDVDVSGLGCSIREHDDFRPKGTNVDFVKILGPDHIAIRTYERGVEGETLACGTGATASAIASSLAGKTRPPVRVKTKSGETLSIDFKIRGAKVEEVTLSGSADFVYDGTWIVS